VLVSPVATRVWFQNCLNLRSALLGNLYDGIPFRPKRPWPMHSQRTRNWMSRITDQASGSGLLVGRNSGSEEFFELSLAISVVAKLEMHKAAGSNASQSTTVRTKRSTQYGHKISSC
jgi:hypothetical protein